MDRCGCEVTRMSLGDMRHVYYCYYMVSGCFGCLCCHDLEGDFLPRSPRLGMTRFEGDSLFKDYESVDMATQASIAGRIAFGPNAGIKQIEVLRGFLRSVIFLHRREIQGVNHCKT